MSPTSSASRLIVLLFLGLLGAVAVIVVRRHRDKGVEEYFFAGRSLDSLVAGLSLFSATICGEWLLGVVNGAVFNVPTILFLAIINGAFLMVLAGPFVRGVIDAGIRTMPEYLSRRSSPAIRQSLSALAIAFNVMVKIPLLLLAGTWLLDRIFGWDPVNSATLVIVITGTYTIVGGFRTISILQMIQAVAVLAGIAAFCIAVFDGDLAALTMRAGLLQRSVSFQPSWMAVLLGGPVIAGWYWCSDQSVIQRVISTSNARGARRAALITLGLSLIVPAIVLFVMDNVPAGLESIPAIRHEVLSGLMATGILSVVMSSLASALHSTSTLFTFDLYQKTRQNPAGESLVLAGRLTTTVIVVLCILIVTGKNILQPDLPYLESIQLYFAPPIAAVVFVILFLRRGNPSGALWALAIGEGLGLSYLLYRSGAAQIHTPPVWLAALSEIHPFYIATMSFVISVVVALIPSSWNRLSSPLKNGVIRMLTLALACMAVFGLTSCSRQYSDLATVGNRGIDSVVLRQSFELSPRWSKGMTTEQAYFRQLQYLVNQKLAAADADRMGFSKDSSVMGYLRFLEDKELIKALYRQEVTDKVVITEAEYEAGYRRMQRTVDFEYIYSPDSVRLLQYAAALGKTPVDRIGLIDTLVDSKGKKQGIGYGTVVEELEPAVFDSPLHHVTAPIRLQHGYMAVKVVGGEERKFQSAYDFAEQKHKVKKVVFDRRADALSTQYVAALLKDKALQLDPEVFRALTRLCEARVRGLRRNPFNGVEIAVTNNEVRALTDDIRDIRSKTLIRHADGSMTVGEFLAWLGNMPAGLRPQVRMAASLKAAIGVAVRNRYLVQIARERGLDRLEPVRRQIEAQQDEALATVWYDRYKDSIAVSPDDITRYYAEHTGTDSTALDPDMVREEIRSQKLEQRMPALIEGLTARYGIVVDSARVRAIIPHPHEVLNQDPLRMVVRELFL